jgi:glycerophosphoryl diester phosphodiesterase
MFRPLAKLIGCLAACMAFPGLTEDSPMLSDQQLQPVVIAHRGASGYLPEHSLPAVVAAHVMGADYIEQDIVLSKDHVPVVLHDIYLEATTDVEVVFPNRARADGRFYAIDFLLTELKTLTLHERTDAQGSPVFPGRFPTADLPLRIPTLAEEVELILGLNQSRETQAGLYIELKAPQFHTQAGADIAGATLSVLTGYGLDGSDAPVVFQCFDPKTLIRLRQELGSPLPLIQLIADNSWNETPGIDFDAMRTEAGLAAVAEYANGIGPWLNHLFQSDGRTDSGLVSLAHSHELLVHTYTLRADELPENWADFSQLQEAVFVTVGVDGAFTDFPDLTRAFLDNLPANQATTRP